MSRRHSCDAVLSTRTTKKSCLWRGFAQSIWNIYIYVFFLSCVGMEYGVSTPGAILDTKCLERVRCFSPSTRTRGRYLAWCHEGDNRDRRRSGGRAWGWVRVMVDCVCRGWTPCHPRGHATLWQSLATAKRRYFWAHNFLPDGALNLLILNIVFFHIGQKAHFLFCSVFANISHFEGAGEGVPPAEISHHKHTAILH